MALLEVMMALGTYRFGLMSSAYQNLTRSASWRWPAQDRLGAHPVLQYTGPGEQSIRLDGILYPHYKGLLGLPNLLLRSPELSAGIGYAASINSVLASFGLSDMGSGHWQLEGMRMDANSGSPLSLVDGRGRNWGYWSITDLEERETRHMADGSALAVDFGITLSYYGENAPNGIGAENPLVGIARQFLGI